MRPDGHSDQAPSRTRTIGILSVADARKGLWRDTQILHWLVSAGPVRPAGGDAFPSVFCVSSLLAVAGGELDTVSIAPPEPLAGCVVGMPLREWLEQIDVLVFCEVLLVELLKQLLDGRFRSALERIIYVVNLDWAWTTGGTSGWVSWVRWLQKRGAGRFVLWSKTPQAAQMLREKGITSESIPWTTCDRVRRARDAGPRGEGGAPVFFANVGMGGWRDRRCTDVLLKAWRKVSREPGGPQFLLKSIKPMKELAPAADLNALRGATFLEGYLPRQQVGTLYDRADVYIHMSRWEGFGLPLAEALHAGLPCIVSDVSPLNELVIDYRAEMTHQDYRVDALLVGGSDKGRMRLAYRFEPDPDELAGRILDLWRDPDLRSRLSCPEPGVLEAKQYAFRLLGRASLLDEKEPAIQILTNHHDSRHQNRLSEQYWADALALHGYRTVLSPARQIGREKKTALRHLDSVWMGKLDPSVVKAVRATHNVPLLLWHHDLIEYSEERSRWWSEVIDLVDAAAVSEGGLERFGNSRAALRTVFPGAKVESACRPPGRRARYRASFADDTAPFHGVVFLGGCDRSSERRALVLKRLRQAGIPIKIHGNGRGWCAAGFTPEEVVFGKGATNAYRSAAVSLSVSRGSTALRYTSNRLFNIASAGGVPLAEDFAGVDDLFPGAPKFRTLDEALALCQALLEDKGEAAQVRRDVEAHVFRHHSWLSRVRKLLSWQYGLHAAAQMPPTTQQGNHLRPSSRSGGRAMPLPLPPDQSPLSRGPGEHKDPPQRPQGDPVDPEGLRLGQAWETRATETGERGVGHIRWSNDEYQRQSEIWWQRLEPILGDHLVDGDRLILDFGCGVGRFSRRLASTFHRRVVGVDISPTYLGAAEEACSGLEFEGLLVPPGVVPAIPFSDGALDVLWTCTVLQHLPDTLFMSTMEELLRLLHPGALVLLVENTGCGRRQRTSQSGHVVFRRPSEYQACFPGIDVVDQWDVAGETHSVFLGRLGVGRNSDLPP